MKNRGNQEKPTDNTVPMLFVLKKHRKTAENAEKMRRKYLQAERILL